MGTAIGGVLHHPVGDHILAWTPDGTHPVLVDAIDWLLWQFCDGSVTEGELTEDLVASVDISSEDARFRVSEARTNLAAAGLLVGTDPIVGQTEHFPQPPNN